jgi:hypothetical protein
MSPNVDVVQALELLAKLEPELLAHEATVPRDLLGRTSLGDGETLDRALRAGLARLHVEIGRETFIYLRWRAERARAAAVCAETAERDVRDAAGRLWTVSEASPSDLFGSASPRWLVFRCGAARHQTSDYPPDWRARSDEELCRLITLGDHTPDEQPEAPRAR